MPSVFLFLSKNLKYAVYHDLTNFCFSFLFFATAFPKAHHSTFNHRPPRLGAFLVARQQYGQDATCHYIFEKMESPTNVIGYRLHMDTHDVADFLIGKVIKKSQH